MFIKYQHIKRLGDSEVYGLLDDTVLVFPKIDGTNASVWVEDSVLCAGSRNRKLSLESDNAGFYNYVLANSDKFFGAIIKMADIFDVSVDDVNIYGEWLVPHTIQSYRKDAWRRFYTFDVLINGAYIPYSKYSEFVPHAVPPIAEVHSPTIEAIANIARRVSYLQDDGTGEGVVVKRYDFVNKYGRTVWGKYVNSEFKDSNTAVFGPATVSGVLSNEACIVSLLTDTLLEKEFAKMGNTDASVTGKFISTVYHCLVTEELWNGLRKLGGNKVIDFKKLNRLTVNRAKLFLRDKGVL